MGRVYCGPIYNLGREKVAKEEPEERRRRGEGRKEKEKEFTVKKQNLNQGVRKNMIVHYCSFFSLFSFVLFCFPLFPKYAQNLILVNLILVNIFGFLIIARNPPKLF